MYDKNHLLPLRLSKGKTISVCSGLVAHSKRTDLPLRTYYQLDETCRENQRKGVS